MKISPPWYFECGWWSPWCFIDEWAHRLSLASDDGFICRKHDEAAEKYYAKLDS